VNKIDKHQKKLICSVYAAERIDQLYVYLPKSVPLTELPEALQKQLGRAKKVMDVLVTPEKTLAKVSGARLLEAFESEGFYLQMPPAKENLLEVHREQSALSAKSSNPDGEDG